MLTGFSDLMIRLMLICGGFLVVMGLVGFFLKRLVRSQEQNDFDRRDHLVGQLNIALGRGRYAFTPDYHRAIFINEAEDAIGFGWWAKDAVRREFVQAKDILGVDLEEDPVKRLGNLKAPVGSLPKTCVSIRRNLGRKPLAIILGDEATAAEWHAACLRVAQKNGAGTQTMRSPF